MSDSWLSETLEKLSKLRIANFARLMQDNQKTLDAVQQDDKFFRGLRASNLMGKQGAGVEIPKFNKEDDMGINIDSPTTVTYNLPKEEKKTSALTGTLMKVLLGAALGGGGVAGVQMITNMIQKVPAITDKVIDDSDTLFQLRLGPPEKGQKDEKSL